MKDSKFCPTLRKERCILMDFKNMALGIEFGSTRIKAVLIDREHQPVAGGSYTWENQLVNGVWTYSMEKITEGLQACYADLKRDVREKFGITLTTVGAIGISGMMHGYFPFDAQGNALTEFRTWRNTMTGEAAEKLTALFEFNIPQRWSIAHLYQAMLWNESHLLQLDHITTLAGYIHERLTGNRVLGIGEASGVFPIDSLTGTYDSWMMICFDQLIREKGYQWTLASVLPTVLPAGACAGHLTKEGAAFLDPQGDLEPGIPFAPPEGDAGTGMVATNSVAPRTGNVSAGTSDFAMIVVEKMPGVHREIDMVTTPDGMPVAMVHCNNCTSDLNAWVGLFREFADCAGFNMDTNDLYTLLFRKALEGEPDCGGLLSYNYLSGEGVTDFNSGRPLFVRQQDAKMSLANFMRTHLLSSLATLKIGLDILRQEEDIEIDRLFGHGGFFKTEGVGQKLLSAAVKAPVSVMETAGEGGPYGMALLAGYLLWKEEDQSLSDYLEHEVFSFCKSKTLMADPKDIKGFSDYLRVYVRGLPIEQTAIDML